MGEHQRIFNRITGSAAGGTRILRVLSVSEFVGDGGSEFCEDCVEKMQVGYAEVRRKAWVGFPGVFGLKARILASSKRRILEATSRWQHSEDGDR